VDPSGGSWRVLDDAGEPIVAPHPPGGTAGAAEPGPRSQWWLGAVIAIGVAVLAGGWLLLSSAGAGDANHIAVESDPSGAPRIGSVVRAAALPSDGTGALVDSPSGVVAGPGQSSTGAAAGSSPGPSLILVVDVNGAVRHPGVVRLPDGARVGDAIAAAGGFGPRVDSVAAQAINLAAKVSDGEQIHVPSRDDPPAPSAIPNGMSAAAADGFTSSGTGTGRGQGSTAGAGSGSGASVPSGPVDLNTATEAQLEGLPAIGPVTAAKIIAARQQSPFRTVDDLRDRKLLGSATLEKIRALVTVH